MRVEERARAVGWEHTMMIWAAASPSVSAATQRSTVTSPCNKRAHTPDETCEGGKEGDARNKTMKIMKRKDEMEEGRGRKRRSHTLTHTHTYTQTHTHRQTLSASSFIRL